MVSGHYLASRRKPILVMGFTTAFLGLLVTALADTGMGRIIIYGIVLGTGIGSVYCIMAGAIRDHTFPTERATAIGVYKFWRDSGYAVGGLLTGVVADLVPTMPEDDGPPSIGSLSIPTFLVAGLVGLLIVCILIFYREGRN